MTGNAWCFLIRNLHIQHRNGYYCVEQLDESGGLSADAIQITGISSRREAEAIADALDKAYSQGKNER